MMNHMTTEQQERALGILDDMALENKRPWWAFWRRRWFISDEKLRIDAAMLLEELDYHRLRPKETRRLRVGVELGLLASENYHD